MIPKQHFTQPPGRYTESALVKALEERGIGRPSTYAAIIKTLKERDYVILDKRVLAPTPLGEATCDALIAAFPDVMDYQFTAQVEDWLDDVSRGERDWVQALRDFYDPFALALASAPPKMAAFKGTYRGIPVSPTEAEAGEEENATGKTSSRKRSRRSSGGTRRAPARATASKEQAAVDPNAPLCPKCGSSMIKRTGPRGEFWGCSTFPKCKGTRNL